MKKTDVKKQIDASHRMGRTEGSVRACDVLSDEQCLQYIKDAIFTGLDLDPLVAQEMLRGFTRSKKVEKQLNNYYKNHSKYGSE